MSQRIKLEEAKLEDLPEIQRLAEVTWEACYPGIISAGQIRYILNRGYQLDVLKGYRRAQIFGLFKLESITNLWVLERIA